MLTQHAEPGTERNAEITRPLEIRDEARDVEILDNLSQQADCIHESGIVSFVFHKDQLDALSAVTSATGFRVYLGATSSGQPNLMIYPCDISADESVALK